MKQFTFLLLFLLIITSLPIADEVRYIGLLKRLFSIIAVTNLIPNQVNLFLPACQATRFFNLVSPRLQGSIIFPAKNTMFYKSSLLKVRD